MSHEAESADPTPRGALVPRVHTAFDGTPYFDNELGVPQTTAHRIMAVESGAVLAAIAKDAGLSYLSDEPIWYLHPETDEQKAFYGDCVIGKAVDTMRITAADVLLVIEVVSTNDRRKELKDTRFQRLLNEYNAVPELGLAFPEVDDPRALTWCRLRDGEYEEHVVGSGGIVRSEAVPGLELRVLPRERWEPGHKIELWYRGELRPRLAGERARAQEARARADEERARADEERARAERLAAHLRELGVDPDEL